MLSYPRQANGNMQVHFYHEIGAELDNFTTVCSDSALVSLRVVQNERESTVAADRMAQALLALFTDILSIFGMLLAQAGGLM
jgi:hypothetical protein